MQGGDYDFTNRIYDPRIGRFLSVDPLAKDFGWTTPYAYAENDVIRAIDLEGLEKLIITVRAFIPYDQVKLDVTGASDQTDYQLAVHGDGPRKFIYDLGAAGYGAKGKEGYRVEYNIEIDMDKPSGTNPLAGNNFRAGETSIFLLDENDKKTTIFWTGFASINDIKVDVDADEIMDKGEIRTTSVKFSTSSVVPVPLMKDGFPAIDISFKLDIEKNKHTGEIKYSGTANLDGFPAVEMFILNKTTSKAQFIFGDSPNSPNDGLNLLPFLGDRQIDLGKGQKFVTKTGPGIGMGMYKQFYGPTREQQQAKTAGKDEF